jgi:hypothetical protein
MLVPRGLDLEAALRYLKNELDSRKTEAGIDHEYS